MKSIVGLFLRGFGYLFVITAIAGLGGSTSRASSSARGMLLLLAIPVVVGLSRHRSRVYAEKILPRRRTRIGLIFSVLAHLAVGWTLFMAFPVLIAFQEGNASPAAGAVVLIGLGILTSIDVAWRVARRISPKSREAGKASQVPPAETAVVISDPKPEVKRSHAGRKSSLGLAIIGGVLLLAAGLLAALFFKGGIASSSISTDSKMVRVIALNDRLAEIPKDETRRDIIHVIVIVRQSWVTLEGGWSNSPADEAAALEVAVFEAKRRGATAIQLGIQPKYDRELGFYIYKSVKVYEPDGRLVYVK